MKMLYKFPKAAAFGKMIAKSKIYENIKVSTKIKDLFVEGIEKIIWSYKLSSETINIPASVDVQEIQILTVSLRTEKLSHDVLHMIDKAIPSPILFELQYGDKTKYAACYKRRNEADRSKWVVSSYFQSDWLHVGTTTTELPVKLNMEALYQSLLESLSPLPPRQEESLNGLFLRVDSLRDKEREARKLRHRMKKEKQFNRRVELNQILNVLKQEIEGLKS